VQNNSSLYTTPNKKCDRYYGIIRSMNARSMDGDDADDGDGDGMKLTNGPLIHESMRLR